MHAVWSIENRGQMNITLAFAYDFTQNYNRVNFELAAGTVFRVLLDGEIKGYGPMRSAHTTSHIHSYTLENVRAGSRLVVEVAGYNINTYYVLDEPPFFAGELIADGMTLADSFGFTAYRLDDRMQKVLRYSFQRAFTEVYHCEVDRIAFYTAKQHPFKRVEVDEVYQLVRAGHEEHTGGGLRVRTLLDTDLSLPTLEKLGIAGVIETGEVIAAKKPYPYWDRYIYNIGDTLKGFTASEVTCDLSKEISAYGFSKREVGACLSREYKLYDFGRNATGFITFGVDVVQDCEIYGVFDEILWTEVFEHGELKDYYTPEVLPLIYWRLSTCNVVKYTLKKGHYELMTFEPYTMRYLKLLVTSGEACIGEPSLTLYENADMYHTKFTCADKALEQVFLASQYTIAQNSVDVLTDCPSRERAGWLCDSFFSSRVERLLTGENKVEKNFLRALQLAPQLPALPDGMFPMCYPSDHLDGVHIPNWAMWFVIELDDYVKRTGDSQFVKECQVKVVKLCKLFEGFENEYGLLEKLQSWVCVEHSRAAEFVQDVSFPSNMLYVLMLRCVSRLYNDDRAREKADKITQAIRELSFNGEFYVDNAVRVDGKLTVTNNTTETCQYYAFFTGVATREKDAALYTKMLNEFGATRDSARVYPNVYPSNAFIGNYLRLIYFYEQGERAKVLAECKDYFLFMTERTMTLWEHNQAVASCNHAFAAYPVVFIVNALTGFQRADLATRTLYFEPLAVLCDCTLTLPVGGDTLDIQVTQGSVKLLHIPMTHGEKWKVVGLK